MAKTTRTGAVKAPKTDTTTTTAAPDLPVAAVAPVAVPDPPFVTEARAIWDRLDERERIARSLNCLMHGHPAGLTVVNGETGVFCPHCCTWLDDPGS
jgi:hypothetical protein